MKVEKHVSDANAYGYWDQFMEVPIELT